MLTKIIINQTNTSAALYFEDRETVNLVASTPAGLVNLLRAFGIELSKPKQRVA